MPKPEDTPFNRRIQHDIERKEAQNLAKQAKFGQRVKNAVTERTLQRGRRRQALEDRQIAQELGLELSDFT
jgi:hypothetical protein